MIRQRTIFIWRSATVIALALSLCSFTGCLAQTTESPPLRREDDTRARAEEQQRLRLEEIERLKKLYGEHGAQPAPASSMSREDRLLADSRRWNIQYVPPSGPGYSPESRSNFLRVISDRQRLEQQQAIAKQGDALRKRNAPMYLQAAERAHSITEKAHNYRLAGDLLKEFPDAVPGRTAAGIFATAANLYRATPSAPGADHYFFLASQSDRTNGDWPLLMAQHNWERNVDISEKFLKDCLNCPVCSPGTKEKARQLLSLVPSLRAQQQARAQAMAASAQRSFGNYSYGFGGSSNSYIDDVFKAGASSYGSEGEEARRRLGWD